MAHVSICRVVFFIALVVSVSLISVAAKTSELAPLPAMDVGAGIPVPYSGAFVCASLLISLITLLWH
ncbi:hypothetical protein RGQ29_001960 [Quercus rubra]|uniref:Transmembrane protein n=1 Tax=Quercus rubra TaxID=3512 RepID=A0AAN7G8E4_QUERU|nr:hypothetical protein RGQ29_001960 [Quercus rubra]